MIFRTSHFITMHLIFFTISAGEKNFRDDIKELKKLNQNILYDALKHEEIQNHVDLDDEDKEFLSHVSKGN